MPVEIAAGTGTAKGAGGPGGGGGAGGSGGAGGAGGEAPVADMKGLEKCSSTLSRQLEELKSCHGKISYGPPGVSSSYNAGPPPKIVMNPSRIGDPAGLARTLAHELGHFTYPPPDVRVTRGMPRGEFVNKFVESAMVSEAYAVMNNEKIRKEILDKKGAGCGKDVGVNGEQGIPTMRPILDDPMTGKSDLEALRERRQMLVKEIWGHATDHAQHYAACARKIVMKNPDLFS